MKDMIVVFEKKLLSLSNNLGELEFSAIIAGINDLIEGADSISENIKKINNTVDVEEIYNLLIDIQLEITNHLKQHITEMENPLNELIESIE